MTKDPLVLQESKDPRELVRMAKVYASSDSPADQAILLKSLSSKDFLERLDTPVMYQVAKPHQLRVAGIIRVLMEHESAVPRQTIVNLIDAVDFQSLDQCVPLLIRALASVRPACERTIGYWKRQSDPESVYSDHVVDAIFLNRSRPALELFERMMNEPGHGDEYKYFWLRNYLLVRRNDPEVLRCCERMVVGSTISTLWHEPVLEAVFDYDPTWYRACRKPRPPLRIGAGDESKDLLKKLGKHGLLRDDYVSVELPLKIKLALKEIGRDDDDDVRNAPSERM